MSTSPAVARSVAGRVHHAAGRCRAALTLVLLVLGCSITVFASAALAADAPPPTTDPTGSTGQGVTSSFALAPTGTDPSEPSSRPNLTYSLAPGGAVQDSVTVWNYSDIPLDFDLYATDAFNTKQGGFDVLADGTPSTDAGSWVTLAQRKVTVPANSSLEVPIAVTVPAGAHPGDHTAGIIASSKTPGTDAEGHHVVFDRRTGSRLYLRVTGPVNPSLAVTDLSTEYHASVNSLDGSMDVTYTVRNTGNVRLGAHQLVTVKDLFGTVDERKGDDIAELLPGASLTYHEHFTRVAATLRVSADVQVTPFAPKTSGGQLPKGTDVTTASSSSWAVPWTLVLLLVLIGASVYVVRRRRRNRADLLPVAPAAPARRVDHRRARRPAGRRRDRQCPWARATDGTTERRERRQQMGLATQRLRAPVVALAGAVLFVLPLSPASAVKAEPTVHVDPGASAPGQTVVVRLDDWPETTATVSVCGNAANRGSQDCDVRAAQSVAVAARGSTFVGLPLTAPPVACPCVVRAETSASGLVRTTTVELEGVPVAPPTPAPGPAKASDLDVATEVVDGDESWPASWSGAFGGPTTRRLHMRLTNTGDATLSGMSVAAYLGRDSSSGSPVGSKRVGALAPHSSEVVELPVQLGAPAWGEYHVFGQVFGLDAPVAFGTTTHSSPWAWEVILPLALLAVARLLRRRDRARVATERAAAAALVPGAAAPVATATPASAVPALSERSPDVLVLDEGRSEGPVYDPQERSVPTVASERDLASVT